LEDITVATKKQTTVASNSNSKTKAKQAGSGKRATTVAPTARNVKSATASMSAPPALNNDVIGNAAGKVWGSLAQHGAQSLADLKKSLDAPNDVVLAALGWLARENKLQFSAKGRTVVVALRDDN
jgi:hypothetical protein